MIKFENVSKVYPNGTRGLEDINLDTIPINVLQDVDKRIADWRATGGKDSDTYIQNQLRYLKRVELMANNAADTITYF